MERVISKTSERLYHVFFLRSFCKKRYVILIDHITKEQKSSCKEMFRTGIKKFEEGGKGYCLVVGRFRFVFIDEGNKRIIR